MTSKRLAKGDFPPDFSGSTVTKRDFRLKDFDGSLVWLILYRYIGCPICQVHFVSLLRQRRNLEKLSLNVICVFETEEKFFTRNYLQEDTGNIYLVSDSERVLYNFFAGEVSLSKFFKVESGMAVAKAILSGGRQGRITGKLGQQPAHFLIDESGVIEKAYYGRHIGDHIPFERVVEFAEKGTKVWDWSIVI